MAQSYNETDTVSGCAVAAACTSNTVTTGTSAGRLADGALGSASTTFSLQKSAVDVIAVMFEIDPPAGTTWGAGTWTIRLNITTANTTLTWDQVAVCRVNSSCASQASIGSTTALGISLGTTGVKSATVSGTSQTPSAGDKVLIVLSFNNSSTMVTESAAFTPNQAIDTPFTAPVAAILPLVVQAIYRGVEVLQ